MRGSLRAAKSAGRPRALVGDVAPAMISGTLPAAIIGQAYDASLTVTPGGSAITLDSATLSALAARNIAHNGFGRFTSAGVTA